MSKDQNAIDTAFRSLGISLRMTNDGVNAVAMCPFTDKKDKLVVNMTNGLWDSKTAGIGGNFNQFLDQFYHACLDLTDKMQLSKLASSRSLPVDAFDDLAMNQLTGEIIIPQRDITGTIVGLARYTGKAVYRLAGSKVVCNYLHEVIADKTSPIYITEGEWDTIALKYMLKMAEEPGIVITIPGAGTFKDEWVPYLTGRDVITCYDNDKPGKAGEQKAVTKLYGKANLKCLYWEGVANKDGYDVRDYITEKVKKKPNTRTAKIFMEEFKELIGDRFNFSGEYLLPPKDPKIPPIVDKVIVKARNSPQKINQGTNKGDQEKELLGLDLDVPTREKVYEIFSKNLRMVSYVPVDIIMGTCFANRIEGDPVWTLLVAPPGGSKTEFLMTLNGSEWIETTTSLTPAALISGIKFDEGNDPSLLIKINEKMLVIKDFTTILSSQPAIRDEIFGILRDAYDGYVEKFFGTGVKKSYHSKFGILAGVTPAIDAVAAQHSSLGERFLKFRMARYETEQTEIDKIMAAMNGVGSEGRRRDELQNYVAAALRADIPTPLPRVSPAIQEKIMYLSMFTATIRGAVPRDGYTGEMLCMPIVEVGTRLSKQLIKLAMGIAIFHGKDEIDAEILDILKLVAWDTCPDRVANIVRAIRTAMEDKGFAIAKEIISGAKISDPTWNRLQEALKLLNIVEKVDEVHIPGQPARWVLSKKVTDLYEKAFS